MNTEIVYNVIVSGGYVEEYRPAKLWLNYSDDGPKLAARDIAKKFFDELSNFVKQDIPEPNSCCKKAKKRDNFCSRCGRPVSDDSDVHFEVIDRVQNLFFQMISGNLDSLAGESRGYVRPEEFLEENGWLLCGIVVDGPAVEITSFDRYIEDPNNRCTEFLEGEIEVKGLRS